MEEKKVVLKRKKKLVLKKKAFAFLIITILTIIILTIILVKIILNSKKLNLEYEKELNVSLNDKITNLDAIRKIKNGKILTKKKKINTTKIRKIKVTFEVEDYFKKKTKYHYIIIINDKEKPTIKYTKELETEEGKELDLLKDVIVEDNSREKITPTIEGEYDFNKAGEYKLFYVAKDSSKNEAREEFILKVTEKKIEKKVVEEKKENNSNRNKTSKGFDITTKNGVTYIVGYLIVNKTYSLPSSYGNGLTGETRNNFNRMKSAAEEEKLDIFISSGYRSYNRQKTLYNNYVSNEGKEEADTYSARPGHSEHQSGLALDVNTVDDSFANTEEAKWLAKNCYKYGFILRYPKGKSNETGYKYEPWHFRYVGEDLATKLYNNGNWITMENYFGITSTYK